MGFKSVFTAGISALKKFVAPMEKYVPSCVKNEVSLMNGGVKSLKGKFSENYLMGQLCAQIEGKGRVKSIASGVLTAATKTKISKEEIPSLFSLAGFCTPLPGGQVVGYAAGRVITSKPVVQAAKYSKKAVVSTYHSVGNVLKV